MAEQWQDPGALAERYGSMVYRLAYARTGNRTDAEDVVQEVFLRLLRARPVFRDEEHVKAWLLRVAANCANDFFRSPWRKREEPLEACLAVSEPREESGVLEAVCSLPPKYRIPIHLFYFEDLSAAEIAKIIGKSEAGVKTRLFRARALLRARLGEEDMYDSGCL